MIRTLLYCFLALAATAAQTEPDKLIEEGHWKRARAIVEPWIRAKPNDALANFLASQICNAFHDRQAPLGLAEKAVRLEGGVARYHRQLAEVLGVTAQHAGMFQQLLLARRFKKEIDTVLAEDPHDLQAMRDLMEFYLLAPGIAGGDREKARAVAGQIARANPAEGGLAQARLAELDHEPAKMEALLRQAAEAPGESYRARIVLADYYLAEAHRNYGLAEQHGREAVRLAPGRVDGYSVLATVYAARGKWVEMDATLGRAEKAVPDDLSPTYRAADAILASGREWPRAEALWRKYLGAETEGNAPTWAEAHWRLGLVLEREGHRTEAVREWSEAVRLDPESPARSELKRAGSARN